MWRRCTSRTHASITDSILGANGFSLRILGHCELHFTIITLPFLSNRVRNSITQRRKCHVTRCSCWPCHAHSSTTTTTFLPSPTRPVNARCSHSPCGCWTHPRRAARVHMKLVLCWSPHMTGSSCQQMASWHRAGLVQLSVRLLDPSLASNTSPYETRVVLEPSYDGLQLPTGGVVALLDSCSKHGTLFLEFGHSMWPCRRILVGGGKYEGRSMQWKTH